MTLGERISDNERLLPASVFREVSHLEVPLTPFSTVLLPLVSTAVGWRREDRQPCEEGGCGSKDDSRGEPGDAAPPQPDDHG